MSQQNDNHFVKNVENKVSRKLKALKHPGRSVWMGLGTMGIVGWSVAVPTLLCLFVGLWLDKHYAMTFSWTLNLLIIGIIIGCFSAWHWVSKEINEIDTEEDND